MASLYQRPASPYWWISYRDPNSGRITRKSTRFKVGLGMHTRRARQICAERTLAEASFRTSKNSEQWDQWVPTYLEARYFNAHSLQRMRITWNNLSLFLAEKALSEPRFITREHCFAYVAWRQSPDKSNGKFRACHNTAITEVKGLAMIMSEALRRGYIMSNPCSDLHLRMRERTIKPELTDADIDFIRGCIEREPEPRRTFFKNSFEIARYQGCRISETKLNPMIDVDIVPSGDNRIRFRTKTGKVIDVPLHPKLIPFFTDLKARGQTQTYPLGFASSHWHNFLKRTGLPNRMPHVCFHSLRVTVATRLARANVPESKAMKFLGHASTTVHRLYQRLRTEDLDDAVKALS